MKLERGLFLLVWMSDAKSGIDGVGHLLRFKCVKLVRNKVMTAQVVLQSNVNCKLPFTYTGRQERVGCR